MNPLKLNQPSGVIGECPVRLYSSGLRVSSTASQAHHVILHLLVALVASGEQIRSLNRFYQFNGFWHTWTEHVAKGVLLAVDLL